MCIQEKPSLVGLERGHYGPAPVTLSLAEAVYANLTGWTVRIVGTLHRAGTREAEAVRTQRRTRCSIVHDAIAIVVKTITDFSRRHATAGAAHTIRIANLSGRARGIRPTLLWNAAALSHHALATIGAQYRTRRHFIDETITIVINGIAGFRHGLATARRTYAHRRAHLSGWAWSIRPTLLWIDDALTIDAHDAIRTNRSRPIVDDAITIVINAIADFHRAIGTRVTTAIDTQLHRRTLRIGHAHDGAAALAHHARRAVHTQR